MDAFVDMSSHAARIRTQQVIIAALTAGIVSMACAAIFVPVESMDEPSIAPTGEPGQPILTHVSLVVGFLSIALSVMWPRLIAQAVVRRGASAAQVAGLMRSIGGTGANPDPVARLAAAYFVCTLIGAAILEGGAMLLLTAHLIERNVATLAGGLLLGALVAARMPTQERARRWVQRMQPRIGV